MNKTNRTVSVEVPCLAKPLMNVLKPKKVSKFFSSSKLGGSHGQFFVRVKNGGFGNQANLIEANKEHQYQDWLTGDVAIMYLGSLTILEYPMLQRNCLRNAFKTSKILKDQ